MTEYFDEETETVGSDLKKYRFAAYGFFILNVLYVFIIIWTLPPVNPEMVKLVFGGLFIVVVIALILTPLILRGKRLLVQVLTVIYGGRAIYSIYSLMEGAMFPAIPYLLPCVVITFYLLGRAAWDWP